MSREHVTDNRAPAEYIPGFRGPDRDTTSTIPRAQRRTELLGFGAYTILRDALRARRFELAGMAVSALLAQMLFTALLPVALVKLYLGRSDPLLAGLLTGNAIAAVVAMTITVWLAVPNPRRPRVLLPIRRYRRKVRSGFVACGAIILAFAVAVNGTLIGSPWTMILIMSMLAAFFGAAAVIAATQRAEWRDHRAAEVPAIIIVTDEGPTAGGGTG